MKKGERLLSLTNFAGLCNQYGCGLSCCVKWFLKPHMISLIWSPWTAALSPKSAVAKGWPWWAGRQTDYSEACCSLPTAGAVVKERFWLWTLLTAAVCPSQVCEEAVGDQTTLVNNNGTRSLSNTSSRDLKNESFNFSTEGTHSRKTSVSEIGWVHVVRPILAVTPTPAQSASASQR